MADGAVRERSDERGPAEDPVHHAEVCGTPERITGEHRHHDGKRRVEEVRDQHGRHDRAEERSTPDEAQPLGQLGEVTTPPSR
jgi:hypothetical protein